MTIPSTVIREMQDSSSSFASVNGLKMYYEIHGKGAPLALSMEEDLQSKPHLVECFIPLQKKSQVIAAELQGHGHTPDINRPETFEQDADDVAALLKYLKIENADFFGFSNGGHTARCKLQFDIRI